MSLDESTVIKVAKLARLNVPREELPKLVAELRGILNWVEQLQQVDTDHIQPMTGIEANLPLRDDVVADGNNPQQVLANAPEATANFYVVPKVVE